MFTGKKHEDMCPAHHKMSVPSTTNTDMILVSISSDGFLTLMNDGGELRSDIRLPDNEMLANSVKAKFESVGDNEDVLVSDESVHKTPKRRTESNLLSWSSLKRLGKAGYPSTAHNVRCWYAFWDCNCWAYWAGNFRSCNPFCNVKKTSRS